MTKGQAGGIALLAKYGRQHFSAMGKKGGRPRIHQPDNYLLQGDTAVAEIKNKEEWDGESSFRHQLRRWHNHPLNSLTQSGTSLSTTGGQYQDKAGTGRRHAPSGNQSVPAGL